eukprot:TRINITY_DN7993_c0_g1_i1.p3 TRINITY_DN7993_c0_g1~~TRINITY_DN7993_c0_g1_i1.p3  ORF type:complete len:114 (+),score=3.64 TRINITY_DN7993_c0_g1_i1:951-1292(+)
MGKPRNSTPSISMIHFSPIVACLSSFKHNIMPFKVPEAPKCPSCNKSVYFAERVNALSKDWHKACLKCEKCKKVLAAGSFLEHGGKPYCQTPCYQAEFGAGGFGRGGTESHKY